MFFLLLFFVFIVFNKKNEKFDFLLLSENVVRFIFGLILLSEFLSYFNMFSIVFIQTCVAISLIYLFFNFKFKDRIQDLSELHILNKSRIFVYIAIFLLSLSSLIYFPENYDSNTYHLPRIIHWISNQNLNHYYTSVYRQVYQPYLNEICLTYIYCTGGPVSLFNIWQLIFLVLIVLLIRHIILYDLPIQYKIQQKNIFLLFFSISSLILQSVTPKNDIVLMFFLILGTRSLFLISKNKKNILFLFLSFTMAYLIKGTSVIYITSSVLMFFIYSIFRKNLISEYKNLCINKQILIYSIFFCSLILFPTVIRNLNTTNTINGLDVAEMKMYQNERVNLNVALSNSLKNISMHLNNPVFNIVYPGYVNRINNYFQLPDINDSKYNFLSFKYSLPIATLKDYFHSDSIPNFIVFYFLFLSFVVLILDKKLRNQKIYPFFYIFSFGIICLLIFSATLKWQPWHTRLMCPMFLLFIYSSIVILENNRYFIFLKNFVFLFGFITIIFNCFQPVYAYNKITSSEFISFSENLRMSKSWEAEYQYVRIVNTIDKKHQEIGLICEDNARVFPFMSNFKKTESKFFYLNCGNPTSKISSRMKNIKKLNYIIVQVNQDRSYKNLLSSNYKISIDTTQLSKWRLYKNNTL